jgi:hypothetical protein
MSIEFIAINPIIDIKLSTCNALYTTILNEQEL